jgi:hypothetical protein
MDPLDPSALKHSLSIPAGAFDRLRERISGREVETLRALKEIGTYRGISSAALHESLLDNMESLIGAVVRNDPTPSSEFLDAIGQRTRDRFDAGVRSDDIIRAYRASMLVIQQEFADVCEHLGVGSDDLYSIFKLLLVHSDATITHVSLQFQRYMVEKQVADANRSLVFVERLLSESIDPSRLIPECREYGIDPQGNFHLFIAWNHLPAHAGAQAPTAVVEIVSNEMGAGGIAVARQGVCVGLTPTTIPDIAGISIAVGPQLPLSSASRSFELAERTRRWMVGAGRGGVVHYSQPGWKTLIATEPELTAAYAQSVVEPVAALDSVGETLLTTLAVYLMTGRKTNETAGRLYIHENTLRYRLKKFGEVTGEDVNDPDSLLRVTWSLTAAGYLD